MPRHGPGGPRGLPGPGRSRALPPPPAPACAGSRARPASPSTWLLGLLDARRSRSPSRVPEPAPHGSVHAGNLNTAGARRLPRRASSSRIKLSLIASVVPGVVRPADRLRDLHRRAAAPGCARSSITASGVFANFGGVPLAFLFIATLGIDRPGDRLAERPRAEHLRLGLHLYTLAGVAARLHVLPDPADGAGHRCRRWRGCARRGGRRRRTWARPVLAVLALRRRPGAAAVVPGRRVLLFGTALAAYATAEALTGGHRPADHRSRSGRSCQRQRARRPGERRLRRSPSTWSSSSRSS